MTLDDAAVLAPVFRDAEGTLRILLLVRADRGRPRGQLGLPGGRPEPGDHDFLATALRETQEEIGLPPEDVEVLASLEPLETTATGFRVHPFLGRIPGDTVFRPTAGGGGRPAHSGGRGARRRDRASASSRSRRTTSASRSRSRESRSKGTCSWGMTLRLLDDLVPRLLAGEWEL